MASARVVDVVVLITANQRGEIFTSSADGSLNGGIAPALHFVAAERREHPFVVAMDTGNSTGGKEHAGKAVWNAIGALQQAMTYDVRVPGLDDIEYRLENLQRQDGATVLAANAEFGHGHPWAKLNVQPYTIVQREGVSVAFIGLVAENLRGWKWDGLLGEADIETYRETLNRVLPELKARRPDVIVLTLSDEKVSDASGLPDRLRDLAFRYPELDLIVVSGRDQHISPTIVRGLNFVPAPRHPGHVARLSVSYDTVSDEVRVRDVRMIQLREHGAKAGFQDPSIQAALEEAQVHMNDRVASVESVHVERGSHGGAWDMLVCNAVASQLGADIVLHRPIDTEPLETGSITRGDIWAHVPAMRAVGVAQFTVAELRGLLDRNVDSAGGPDFLMANGVRYEMDAKTESGKRIGVLHKQDGTPWHARKKLRVAFSGELLASRGGQYAWLRASAIRPEARLRVEEVDTHLALVEYMRSRSPLRIEVPRDVTVVGDTVR